MKKSTKILLGIATIWPIVYMFLFFVAIFSFVIFLPFAQERSNRNSQDIDLIQLERKIKNGQLKFLMVKGNEITATDRVTGQQYCVFVSNEESKAEILKLARELAGGTPLVDKVEEESAREVPALVPIGFFALFAAHMFTMLLIMGLMVVYIVQVVKTDRLDQTMRIIWVVLICMMGMLAMPVYWYLYIWRDAPPASSVPSSL